jgi:uncharacterized membrane protein YoaK (UPF0700 family)
MMNRDDLGHLALAVTLTSVAGYVDAVGFLKLGHLFVSFMSGDSTQFAVSSGKGAWNEAAIAGGIVCLFVVGVICGRVLSGIAGRWRRPAVLVVEAALLVSAMVMSSRETAMMVPMVLAMGVQNAAIHRAGHAKTSLTYVTGTLVNLGEKIVDAFSAAKPEERWAWVPYLLFWLGLVIGAVAGAAVYALLHQWALFVPVAVLVVLAAISATSPSDV